MSAFQTHAAALAEAPRARTPMWVKLAYTAFCAVLVPVYLHHYGPTNFVYFCDEALLLTLAGIWLESALLVSMSAVGILLPQAVWVIDFVATALGHPILGMTSYMFDAEKPLFLRLLSGFHGVLPFVLVYLVAKLGYDHRALVPWTILAVASMLVSYFVLPMPSESAGLTPVNVDYVFGLSDRAVQTVMPGWLWLLVLVVGLPALVFWPTHLVLRRLARPAGEHPELRLNRAVQAGLSATE